MFSVITNIYNKKTKGPALMELFTAKGKLKKFFVQLEMFDVYTTGDKAHFDTIFKFDIYITKIYGTVNIRDIQVLATHASTWVQQFVTSEAITYKAAHFPNPEHYNIRFTNRN
jgi:hypothetical protein